MTAFETYLEQNGWELVFGNRGNFSTYHNVSRSWSKDGIGITIGLVAKPTMIAIIFPIYDFLPAADQDYDKYINKVLLADHTIHEFKDGYWYSTPMLATKRFMESRTNHLIEQNRNR